MMRAMAKMTVMMAEPTTATRSEAYPYSLTSILFGKQFD